jgi:sec-independent protein translocase protein TatC
VVNLALAFGCGFQIPIVVIFLIAVGIVRAEALSKARKYIILIVAVLAAILTPTPDVGTMLLLMVPMILLFEIGLLIGRVVERRRAAETVQGSPPPG